MRKFMIVSAILMGLVSSAHADLKTPQELAAILAASKDRSLDVIKDTGADPKNPRYINTYRAFANCFEAIKISGQKGTVTVTDSLTSDTPIDIPNNVNLDGKGIGKIHFPYTHGISVGMAKSYPGSPPLDPTEIAPSDGMVDKTYSKRVGIRLNEHLTIVDLGGVFNAGDGTYWSDAKSITSDIMYSTAGIPDGKGLSWGWSSGCSWRPFVGLINNSKGELIILVQTNKYRNTLRCTVPSLSQQGTHRVSFQCDVTLGKFAVWVDKVPQVIRFDAPVAPDPDCRLLEPNRSPFKVGGASQTPSNTYSSCVSMPPQDGYILGAAVNAKTVYDWDAPQQVRADKQPITDTITYMNGPGNICIRFDMMVNQSVNRIIETRTVATTGKRDGNAYILDSGYGNGYNSATVSIKGLTVEASGDAVVANLIMGSTIEGCSLSGAVGCGIGGWRDGANYGNTVRDTILSGGEAAIFIDYGMWTINNIKWLVTGRKGLWAINAKLNCSHMFVGGATSGNTDSVFRLEGGQLYLNDCDIDNEGWNMPKTAVFDLIARGEAQNSTGVLLKATGVNLGVFPVGVPLIRGTRNDTVARKGYIKVEDWITSSGGNRGNPLVDVDDPALWNIRVDRTSLGSNALFPVRSGKTLLDDNGNLSPSEPIPAGK